MMRAVLRRSWWGVLSLVHIAPLVSATRGLVQSGDLGSHALSALVVWLTFSFFALKFIDVRWLRWRVSRSSVLAFVIACGLAHHDGSAAQGGQALLAEAPGALAGSLLWELNARAARWLPRVLTNLWVHVSQHVRLMLASVDALLIAIGGVKRRSAIGIVAIPRAPPAR